MKLSKLYRIIALLAIFNTTAICSQTPIQLKAIELNRDEFAIAYISCQNIDSIPVLVVNECTDYLFSEEFAFSYDFDFENEIIELKEGIFIEYSLMKREDSKKDKKCFILTPFSQLSEEQGLIFYAIVDEQFFQ